MRLSQLYRTSDQYLAKVLDKSEFNNTPAGFEALMGISRSMRLMKEYLNNAFIAKVEDSFYEYMEGLEEESDEAIHFLDRLREDDRVKYAELLREGEEIISHYVIAYNHLIEKNIQAKSEENE